jgi:hypothetical protein
VTQKVINKVKITKYKQKYALYAKRLHFAVDFVAGYSGTLYE